MADEKPNLESETTNPDPEASPQPAAPRTFHDHIQATKEEIEEEYRKKGFNFPEAPLQAEEEAQFRVSRSWVEDRWGDEYPCPVCGNIEWTLSPVRPVPGANLLGFYVSCRYCGNAMQVIPGHAALDEPKRPTSRPDSDPR